MTRRTLAAAAAGLLLAACGVKAPPRPPIEPKSNPAGAPATTEQGRDR